MGSLREVQPSMVARPVRNSWAAWFVADGIGATDRVDTPRRYTPDAPCAGTSRGAAGCKPGLPAGERPAVLGLVQTVDRL